MSINIDLYENFDGTLNGRYKQGDKPDGASGGTPALAWSAPQGLSDGNTITITTDGTYNFGTKANAKPLLFWTADGGADADLTLGRTNWADGFAGSLGAEQVAPNSSQSAMFDHGQSSGAALGEVTLDVAERDIYVFRRMRSDHAPYTHHAVRTRTYLESGDQTTITEGMTVTGQTSGATGTIRKFTDEVTGVGVGRFTIYYRRDIPTDTVNIRPETDFIYDELMTVSNGVVLRNSEGSAEYPTGTFRTYNYKMMRAWGNPNNSYFGPSIGTGAFDDPLIGAKFSFTHEYTDATYFPSDFTTPDFKFIPYRWENQECWIRQSSAVDAYDATMGLRINGQEEVQTNWRSMDGSDATSTKYDRLYQAQVSNGMEDGAKSYWDCLYVDHDFKRVMIGDAATWQGCSTVEILIPKLWSANSIDLHLRRGVLADFSGKYLYVFDDDGSTLNTNGVLLNA